MPCAMLVTVSHRMHGKAPLENLLSSQGLVAETTLLFVIHTASAINKNCMSLSKRNL